MITDNKLRYIGFSWDSSEEILHANTGDKTKG